MTRLWLALGILLAATPAWSQSGHPRLVRVALSAQVPSSSLLHAGLDVLQVKGEREAELLLWPGDEERLARLGAGFQVLDDDPGRSQAARSRAEIAARPV